VAVVLAGLVILQLIRKKKEGGSVMPNINVTPNTFGRPPIKKALLVGINKYKPELNSDLKGCVNDVEKIREILINIYGFNPDNIRVLTDERAIKEAILDRLRWLVDDLAIGDEIVFDYSGHGSRIRDRDGDELEDHMDEILCVSEDSLITTDAGMITAEQLYNKIIHNEHIKAKVANDFYSISNTHRSLVNNYIEITTENGGISKLGSNHPLFTFNEGNLKLKKASSITKNDALLSAFNYWKDDCDYNPLWYMIGLFIGDGYFKSNKSVRFAYRKYPEAWSNVFKNNGIKDAAVNTYINKRGDYISILRSEILVSKLIEMGFKPYHKKCGCMPKFIIPLNASIAKGFLMGLFDAEGCTTNTDICITMKDEYVIRIVGMLLGLFGIKSYIHKTTKGYFSLTMHDNNASKFISKIGFRFKEKNKIIVNHNSSGDPGEYFMPTLFNIFKKYNIKGKDVSKKLGLHKRNLTRIHTKKLKHSQINGALALLNDRYHQCEYFEEGVLNRLEIGATANSIRKTMRKNIWTTINRLRKNNNEDVYEFNSLQKNEISEYLNRGWGILNQYIINRVKDVKSINTNDGAYMYDFTIDKSKKFEANSLLVHNCPHDLNWDDPLTDDMLAKIFSKVPEGVYLTVIIDACHSGTMTKGLVCSCSEAQYVRARFIMPPFDIRSRALSLEEPLEKITLKKAMKDEGQNHVLLSGCKDNQTSADAYIDNRYQGAMTWAFTSSIRESPKASWKEIHAALTAKMTAFTQNPQLSGDEDLLVRSPFGGV